MECEIFLIKDIMKTNLIKISPRAPLKDGLRLMRKHDIKSIIVDKDKPSDAYGLLQYRDVAKAIVQNEGDIDLLNVYDVATRPVIQISQELEVKYAARMMLDYGVKRILVIDNNQVKGFISMSDVIGSIIDKALKEDEN